MKISDLKEQYGNEYPAAIVVDGLRMPMHKERRFSRSYRSDEQKMGSEISRFMDSSASITASELQMEWPNWDDDIRTDFCQSACWLHEQADFPEMLRFIMQHGSPRDWSGIALSVASYLPQEEAFDLLDRALRTTEIGQTANIAQAIAHTKHPGADAILRKHLEAVWAHPALWDNADFVNWVGFDATTCIAHLIDVGAPPSDFTEKVSRLSEHVCSRNRQSCRNFLSKHYSWLKW